MKIKYVVIFALLLNSFSFSQGKKIEKIKKAITEEGKMLYKSEMASWYGSDIFMEKFGDKKSRIGGYVSYLEGKKATCIFFSNEKIPKTLATITFDSTYNVNTAVVDKTERELTKNESDLADMRAKSLEAINQNKDTTFKFYKKTSFNLIPIIRNNERKVFVLTASTENGIYIIGNDYMLTFDKNNAIVKTERLHNSLLKFDSNSDSIGGVHNHLNGKSAFITSTDICTLMLYSRDTNIESHYVISKDFVSIWVCKSNTLTIMKYEDWQKINDKINKKD